MNTKNLYLLICLFALFCWSAGATENVFKQPNGLYGATSLSSASLGGKPSGGGGFSGGTGSSGGGATDSDGDGWSDDDENMYGTNPYDPNDYPPGGGGGATGGTGGSGSSGSSGSTGGIGGSSGGTGMCGSQWGTFWYNKHISTCSTDPQGVFSIDIEGDGDIDVITAYYTDNKITLYENTGNSKSWEAYYDSTAKFRAHEISINALGAFDVFAIDLDGDTDIDVLSASSLDNKIAWYENDGNGNFTEHIVTSSAMGAKSVFAADIDGDGDMDIISASSDDDRVTWYINDGSQVFTSSDISTTADGACDVFVIDVDDDGDLDVLSASWNDDKIAWHEQSAAHTFTEHVVSSTADSAQSVYAADINGDGNIDLLSASFNDDKISWYENDGSENFTEQILASNRDGATDVISVDFDDDGDQDIVASSYNDGVIQVYENFGSGDFTDNGYAIPVLLEVNGPQALSSADINKDDKMDIIYVDLVDDVTGYFFQSNCPEHYNTGSELILFSPSPSISGGVDALNASDPSGHTNAFAQLWRVETNNPYVFCGQQPLVNHNYDEYSIPMVCESDGDYIIRFTFDQSIDIQALDCYYIESEEEVFHWENAGVLSFNGSSIFNLLEFDAPINYANSGMYAQEFQVAPASGPGTHLQISIEEGTYSPSNMRGPSDPIDGADFGIKNDSSKTAEKTTDSNGKSFLDSLKAGLFKFHPEVPGIKVDSALKNLTINGTDTIILQIVVDNNIIRLKGASANSLGGTVGALSSIICKGDSAQLSLSGHLGDIQWQSSSDSIAWSDISGETATAYTSPALSAGTMYYRAAVTNDTSATAYSSVIAISISAYVSSNISASVCHGSTYDLNGHILSQAGTYYDTLTAASGCDSFIVFNLSLDPTYSDSVSDGICNGASYAFGSQTLTGAGTYTEVFSSVNGCDSTVVMTLGMISSYNDTFNVSICEGNTYSFNGQSLDSSGTYSAQFPAVGGCDSNVVVNLSKHAIYYDTTSASICDGDSYTLGSQSLSAAGTYTEVFQSMKGCDSSATLNLSLYPTPPTANISGSDSVMVNDTASYTADYGSTFTWSVTGGQLVSGSGSDSINVVWSSLGADSIFVSIYDTNGCLVGNLSMGVLVYDVSTEVYYQFYDGIKAYPNPFDNYTRISFDNSAANEYTLFIYNLVGELQRTIENITQSDIIIDKGNLNKGVYIIEISSPRRSLITKIMIN